ncbi:hypothetical protein [Uliginosibacterium gangwonense]|uniref:hypothetical protein n=1 Tax=Uliginosibacterium gangwonense TaxID=392736 RepID=UPI00037812D8|nr:hypothetical protein [Uliginosibacterium gangwonense]
MNVESQIKKLLAQAAQGRSTGELCMEVVGRLPPGTQIRITHAGVRVTHSRYIDKLSTPAAIDTALNRMA